jgi:hypothetical protein
MNWREQCEKSIADEQATVDFFTTTGTKLFEYDESGRGGETTQTTIDESRRRIEMYEGIIRRLDEKERS